MGGPLIQPFGELSVNDLGGVGVSKTGQEKEGKKEEEKKNRKKLLEGSSVRRTVLLYHRSYDILCAEKSRNIHPPPLPFPPLPFPPSLPPDPSSWVPCTLDTYCIHLSRWFSDGRTCKGGGEAEKEENEKERACSLMDRAAVTVQYLHT